MHILDFSLQVISLQSANAVSHMIHVLCRLHACDISRLPLILYASALLSVPS